MSFSASELYHLQCKFTSVAPALRRPEGTFRTPRCRHGLRCDPLPVAGAKWLCESRACPWERPIAGTREPRQSARDFLGRIVRCEEIIGSRKSNTQVMLEALERAGLVVGYRPTPAGVAYATGTDFWGSRQ